MTDRPNDDELDADGANRLRAKIVDLEAELVKAKAERDRLRGLVKDLIENDPND